MKLFNAEQVAELLGEKSEYVYRLAREGILPTVRIGRKVKFSAQALEEFIRNGGKGWAGGWKREA